MDERLTRGAGGGPRGLSAKQEIAARAMVRGKGVVATAKMVGVNRVTLYRWMQEPAFVAAMNRWRSAVFETARGQIAGMLIEAAQTVADRVREGDGRLALSVLKEAGVLQGLGEPGAGLDAGTVGRRMELNRRTEQLQLDEIERQLAEAGQMNEMLRQARTPTAEELAEAHRRGQDDLESAIAKEARQHQGAQVKAERKDDSEAGQPADGGLSDVEAEERAAPVDGPAAPATKPQGAGASGLEAAAAGESQPPSTRITRAEIEKHCAQLTRRRGQPARPAGSSMPAIPPPPSQNPSRPEPPRPGSPHFIGPLPPGYPPRLSGGLAPLYHGSLGSAEPNEPADPLDDAFTEVLRVDR